MTRRNVVIVAALLLLALGITLIGIQTSEAISNPQSSTGDTDMTKSVARITYDGAEACTGSVVGDGWVLTALHCLYPNGDPTQAPLDWRKFTVQLWQAGMDASAEYESGLSEPPVTMSGGDSGSLLYRDVMLLHPRALMPTWVKTIPTAPYWPDPGTFLTEYGYGRVNGTPNAPVATALLKSQQGAIQRNTCPSGFPWTSGHLCTKTTSSLPWKGDSGGPLLWRINGYWQQVGSFSLFPKDETKTWRAFWSEADTDTRHWVLSTVGATAPYGAILRDQASGVSWLYGSDLYRHWIPDASTYNCLVDNGAQVINRPLRTIEALPDDVGSWAPCAPTQPTPTSPVPTSTVATISTPTPVTLVTSTATPGSAPQPVNAYDNYGPANAGYPMCRGNPSNPLSMPGGTVTQTFLVPDGVASLNGAEVQIDPDPSVTAQLSITINSAVSATADAAAAGDTYFSFGPVSVSAGNEVTLTISFTATYGKITTVYTAGVPGGTFTTADSCPDGASNVSLTSTGLRAVVSGFS